MHMLQVDDLRVRAGQTTIVQDIGFCVDEGEWVMLVGPNGAGKSTIANAISMGMPSTGRIFLDGRDIRSMKQGEISRFLGVLAQSHAVSYAFTVEEIVSLGRYEHAKGFLSAKNADDAQKVEEALEITGLTVQRRQSVLTLSGGELQRTFLAQVFAQDPKLLVSDEPTNRLDLKYQQQVFELIRNWLHTPGRAVLSIVHDLSLAQAYGSRAILLHCGKIVRDAPVRDVFTPEALNCVYDTDVFSWMREMSRPWQDKVSD